MSDEIIVNANEQFNCSNCNLSLIGQKYILNEEKPYCITCYESKFSHTCELCKEKITCDSKDLSFKDKHWHERCFFCSVCQGSLADKPFATKDNDLYCPECYDEKFSPRCDGCKKIFKAGSRKYEYKGSTWHEECFTCIECKQPIGAKSFVPKDDSVVCVPCYEEKYSQKCSKCNKAIQKGGVTYKGQPWHKTCFLCTNCSCELAGQKFTSRDEKPYCADCYTQLFAKHCAKCTKAISGFGGCKFVTFEDKHWHSDCFNCSKCQTSLVGKGFLVSDDGVVCPECTR
ncbi:Four and a half LIM domains protein [Schistosoma japonicum]|uniref:Four and a half LIM domains protein n=1 Tax=Schistosoma japonicum TaxID=6182 RepID=C1LEH1_SCHJA|nr:Four and a half LIM domains protein [Schistosoma japonicum]CAX73099.1 Four and a half LIM domains protein 2 [Schistosoma japonicum]